MRIRRPALTALVFTIVHAVVCLLLLPWANVGFQRAFDTGLPGSLGETVGYLLGLILSFPFALWTLWLHPANVNHGLFILSVFTNSLLWGVCIYRFIGRVNRRAGIQQALAADSVEAGSS
jgi:hypothetical protein